MPIQISIYYVNHCRAWNWQNYLSYLRTNINYIMFIILNWFFDLWMSDNFVTTSNVKLKKLLCDCWLLHIHIGFKTDTYRKNCGQQQFQMNSCVSLFLTTVFPRSWRPLLIVSVTTSVPRHKCSRRLLQRQQNFKTWTKRSSSFLKNKLLKPEQW